MECDLDEVFDYDTPIMGSYYRTIHEQKLKGCCGSCGSKIKPGDIHFRYVIETDTEKTHSDLCVFCSNLGLPEQLFDSSLYVMIHRLPMEEFFNVFGPVIGREVFKRYPKSAFTVCEDMDCAYLCTCTPVLVCKKQCGTLDKAPIHISECFLYEKM